jgi:hypothetical protein
MVGPTMDLTAWPAALSPRLADPAPPQLITHEMDWESFERLMLAMARTLDGAYDVRRYGRPGQAQHGLDVVGFFAGRAPLRVSGEAWAGVRCRDLQAAV